MGYLFEDFLLHQNKKIYGKKTFTLGEFFKLEGDTRDISSELKSLFGGRQEIKEFLSCINIHTSEELDEYYKQPDATILLLIEMYKHIDRNIELRNIPDLLAVVSEVSLIFEKIQGLCKVVLDVESDNPRLMKDLEGAMEHIEKQLKSPFILELIDKIENILNED